jgi:hypothetical protein
MKLDRIEIPVSIFGPIDGLFPPEDSAAPAAAPARAAPRPEVPATDRRPEPAPNPRPAAEVPTAPADKPWWRDPATIPPRQSLYDRHYIRGAVSATVAAGGRGKTTRAIYELVSMATGRELSTGQPLPCGPLRGALFNGEEDQDELDRRTAATCLHYGVTQADLGGRLFIASVRNAPLRIATMVKGVPTLNPAAIDQLRDFVRRNRLDVLVIDPLVSFHSVPENDNGAMDVVVKEGFGSIAASDISPDGISIDLLHHPGKPKPGQAETAVEDARGASAVIWAVRVARVLNFMSPEEASKLGIIEDDRRLHIRVSNGKANMGPLGKAKWSRLIVEKLPNGDEVACASCWTPPDPFKNITTTDVEVARELARTGAYRADVRSAEWFGWRLAEHLKIPIHHRGDNPPQELARVKAIIAKWLQNNVLAIEERNDEHRKAREYIIPGSFQPEPRPTPAAADDDDDIAL